jgi:hypothetical protein
MMGEMDGRGTRTCPGAGRDGSAEVGAGHEARGAAAHARDVALRGLPEVRLGRVASTRHDGAFVSTDYFLRGLR